MAETSRYLNILKRQNLDGSPEDCYVCCQMRERKGYRNQEGPTKRCLLCNNPYCDTHKGRIEGVCEINHRTYCSKESHRRRHAPVEIYVSMEARQKALGV